MNEHCLRCHKDVTDEAKVYVGKSMEDYKVICEDCIPGERFIPIQIKRLDADIDDLYQRFTFVAVVCCVVVMVLVTAMYQYMD